MKYVLIFLLVLGSFFAGAQTNSKIYLIRPYNYQGSLVNFNWFIDGKLVCKLKNGKYSVHDIAPGEHAIAVQAHGHKDVKEKTFEGKIIIQEGKEYFFESVMVPKLTFQQLAEINGKALVGAMKAQKKCE